MSSGVPRHALALVVVEHGDALRRVLTSVAEARARRAVVLSDAVQTDGLREEVLHQLSVLVHLQNKVRLFRGTANAIVDISISQT